MAGTILLHYGLELFFIIPSFKFFYIYSRMAFPNCPRILQVLWKIGFSLVVMILRVPTLHASISVVKFESNLFITSLANSSFRCCKATITLRVAFAHTPRYCLIHLINRLECSQIFFSSIM